MKNIHLGGSSFSQCACNAGGVPTRGSPLPSHLAIVREPTLRQQAQVPRQICKDAGEVSSNDDDGYGDAQPTKPSAYPTGIKSIHGEEELSSFDRNDAFTLSLEVDDIPSAQNSLQTYSFRTRQASIPCVVNGSGSPQ